MKDQNVIILNQPPVQKEATSLQPAIIGISDGLIILFAITTGFSISTMNNHDTLVKTSLVTISVGTILMGVSGYFAAKSRQENFGEISEEEEAQMNKSAIEKTIQMFNKLDLDKEMQDQAAIEIEKDSLEWKSFLQQQMQKPEKKDSSQLSKTGIIIAISFALGGVIPVLPYWLFNETDRAFQLSCFTSFVSLLLIGFIKSKINNEPLIWGILRLVLLGTLTGVASFIIVKLFVR